MDLNLTPWITALRSNQFRQTMGTLHNPATGGFCCLGVAAVVFGIADPEKMLENAPSEGAQWIYQELKAKIPRHICNNGIEMNDSGQSFAEIADMIEFEMENPE